MLYMRSGEMIWLMILQKKCRCLRELENLVKGMQVRLQLILQVISVALANTSQATLREVIKLRERKNNK